MSHIKSSLVCCLLCLMVLGLTSLTAPQAFTHSSSQASQGDGGQTLPALLSEVHELRLAIQQSNLNTYHAQITIERMRIQQQRVDRITVQLGDLRGQLTRTKMDSSRLSEHLKETESQLPQETDAAKRAEKEQNYRAVKSELARLTQLEQEQLERETQLNGQLQVEQAKLAEFNERLDTLQRELEVPPAAEKPQPSGKRP